ncbi:hypothetical protein DPMN_103597 [Dreissena polymorpha]|uniref:Uncharacterized protein n=1 Tax=Dreissena polymorpha TaxID=45954 RepID=A0A9D4HA23_DREPO|nr:hypothetical protein DPMN_103597 [Dreissena polymorpha]
MANVKVFGQTDGRTDGRTSGIERYNQRLRRLRWAVVVNQRLRWAVLVNQRLRRLRVGGSTFKIPKIVELTGRPPGPTANLSISPPPKILDPPLVKADLNNSLRSEGYL